MKPDPRVTWTPEVHHGHKWTGPTERDLASDGVSLVRKVPPTRWPFGPPSAHEGCCKLYDGGLFCDCCASAADDLSGEVES